MFLKCLTRLMLIVARLLSCRSFVNSTPFRMFNEADTGAGLVGCYSPPQVSSSKERAVIPTAAELEQPTPAHPDSPVIYFKLL